MFGLKKDRITKILEAKEKTLYTQYKNKMLTQVEMHIKMKEQIKLVYENDTLTFEDVVNRKNYLSGFQPNIFIIASSFVIGVIGTWFYDLANDLRNWVNYAFNYYLSPLINLIVIILLALLAIKVIIDVAKFTSIKDDFITKDYELSIINEQIKQFENSIKD